MTLNPSAVRIVPAILTGVVLAVIGGAASAQEGTAVGGLAFVDEVQVTVVNVDVYVRDGGRPVTGLGVEDFRILQNGVEMPISHFAELDAEVIRERAAAAVSNAPPRAEVGEAPAGETAAPAQAVEIKPIWTVLFIDNENLRTIDRNRVLRRVRDFVAANLEPPVQMMVVSYQRSLEVLQPFTSSPSEVNGALRSVVDRTGGREERDSAQRDLLRDMADARNQDYGGKVNTQAGAELDMRQRVTAFAADEADSLRNTMGALRQVIAMLSGIDGRKSLIYVSSGLPMEPGVGLMHDYAMTFNDQSILSMRGRYDATRLFHELASQANAQEVSLYAIDASGLDTADGFDADSAYSRDPTAASIGSRNYQASLTYMAEATGGLAVINTNDVSGGLRQIADDLYSYYSLGYTVGPSGEDRVNRIEVELTGGQSYDLRYRRRYVDRSYDSLIQDRVFTSLVVDIDDNPMAVELTTGEALPGTATQRIVPVHLSFDLGAVALMPVGDELVARIVVFVGARDDEGRNSEVQRQEHEIRLPAAEYLTDGRTRFGLDFRLLLEQGRQRIAVGVMDPMTRQASYARAVVTVP
ncbi:MAG: VWA domain-containing protein [Thermoanaerobaculales bacterium]|jgi:VWFA-related protein|nr:VWA domain-containing protein [Thermoanaerobaculales bacterium]